MAEDEIKLDTTPKAPSLDENHAISRLESAFVTLGDNVELMVAYETTGKHKQGGHHFEEALKERTVICDLLTLSWPIPKPQDVSRFMVYIRILREMDIARATLLCEASWVLGTHKASDCGKIHSSSEPLQPHPHFFPRSFVSSCPRDVYAATVQILKTSFEGWKLDEPVSWYTQACAHERFAIAREVCKEGSPSMPGGNTAMNRGLQHLEAWQNRVMDSFEFQLKDEAKRMIYYLPEAVESIYVDILGRAKWLAEEHSDSLKLCTAADAIVSDNGAILGTSIAEVDKAEEKAKKTHQKNQNRKLRKTATAKAQKKEAKKGIKSRRERFVEQAEDSIATKPEMAGEVQSAKTQIGPNMASEEEITPIVDMSKAMVLYQPRNLIPNHSSRYVKVANDGDNDTQLWKQTRIKAVTGTPFKRRHAHKVFVDSPGVKRRQAIDDGMLVLAGNTSAAGAIKRAESRCPATAMVGMDHYN